MHSIFSDCTMGDVLFSPGTHSHYEIINRAGLPDVIAIQPGDQSESILPWSRFLAVFGRGKLITPTRCTSPVQFSLTRFKRFSPSEDTSAS